MSGTLRLAALMGSLLSGAEAGAVAIPLRESPCGSPPFQELRCFGLETDLVTTFDQLELEFTITPILPDDPENWQVIGMHAGFGSSAYLFVYPDASADLEAVRVTTSFTDTDGRTFFAAENILQPFCQEAASGPHAGKWVCSDGNSLGTPYIFDGQNPLDPIPPSLDGPITLLITWTVFGSDVPEFSDMSANGATFSYVLERVPIPEPGSGVLVLAGLAGLAHWRKRRGRAT